MNIFELLSFDFGEFITTPACICIIIGILFLAVGIALFFKENKKLQSENATEEGTEEKKEESAAAEPTAPVEEVKAEVAAVEPAVTDTTPIVVPTEGDGVKEVPETPVAETINFDSVKPETPVESLEEIKPETLDVPEVTPVAPVVDTSTVTAPAVETLDAPAVEAPATEPVVYGGASPEPVAEVLEEKPREIYGGANPLENTAPIPTETVREAYAGAQVNVTPVETPAVEPVVAEKPVVEAPVVEAPAVAPVAETPAVVETPAPAEEPKEEIEKLEF